MRRRLSHDESEERAIGTVAEQMNRRNTHRSFAVFLTALLAFNALTTPTEAQDYNVPASAHQSADVGTNGVYKIGGDVSAPVLVYSVAPQVSEKERKVWVDGNVLVNLYVDVKGIPSHVRVVRGLARELDESAVEAVRQYHFKPAMKNGKPVLVQMNVEINFQKH